MTPKQEAKKLVSKFRKIIREKNFNDMDVLKEKSKQCALICVDRILRFALNVRYWHEVKKEIEKL